MLRRAVCAGASPRRDMRLIQMNRLVENKWAPSHFVDAIAQVPAIYDPMNDKRSLTLLRQILTTRSSHRSSHRPTRVLTGQAELAVGEAQEARPSGDSGPMRRLRRLRRILCGRRAAIADRDLSLPRSDAVMLTVLLEPADALDDGIDEATTRILANGERRLDAQHGPVVGAHVGEDFVPGEPLDQKGPIRRVPLELGEATTFPARPRMRELTQF